MKIPRQTIDWILETGTPAIRYNARVLFKTGGADRVELLGDPFVKQNVMLLRNWDKEILERHNKPDLLMHRLALLADLGVKAEDPGMGAVMGSIVRHVNEQSIPEIVIRIPKVFGGTGKPERAWLICDFPVLLYGLLAMGAAKETTSGAVAALVSLADENGFRCKGDMPKFHGPGRREDMCPIACLYAAKALSRHKTGAKSAAATRAVEAILGHWEERGKKKYYLFGIGGDFMKLKFPFVWYNLLHVLETVSGFDSFRRDARVKEMAGTLLSKADAGLRFTPESVYLSYKGQDFADKKIPSPTLTFMALRILKRLDLAS